MISLQEKEMFESESNDFLIIVSSHNMEDFDAIDNNIIKIMINIEYNNNEIPTKIKHNLKNFIKLFINDYKIEKHSGIIDEEKLSLFHPYKKFCYIGIEIDKNDYEEFKEYYICDKCLDIIHNSLSNIHKCNHTGIKRAI